VLRFGIVLQWALSKFGEPKAAAEDWPDFIKLIWSVRKSEHGWPTEFELARKWYEPHLARLYDDAAYRVGDLVQLEQIASGYKSRQKFLTELTLDPPEATTGEGRAALADAH